MKYAAREEIHYKQQLWKDGKATTERGQQAQRHTRTDIYAHTRSTMSEPVFSAIVRSLSLTSSSRGSYRVLAVLIKEDPTVPGGKTNPNQKGTDPTGGNA